MQVFFHKRFKKQYKKLSQDEKEKFKMRRDLFLKDPFHPVLRNHVLSGKYNGFRSVDITGDLRAVYDEVDTGTAHFIYIGTHSQLYG
jgi:addiction module RelE/StbE family toxin